MYTIGQAIDVLILYQILKPGVRLSVNHPLQRSMDHPNPDKPKKCS